MTVASSVPEIVARVEGRVGRITLNRPKALHALTEAMCGAIIAALLAWRADDAIDLVLIDHAGERGFCAGGDIRAMAGSGAGDGEAGRAFFLAEYRMNDLLQRYPKPVAAVMDGVTMGGGVGLSVYALYRVATERTLLAMPETGIGLFPDIGAGWFLSRLPGEFGTWMALTGARLRAADCLHLNLCTHYVPSDRIEALKDTLLKGPSEARRILARFNVDPGPAPLAGKQSALDGLFAHDSVEAILASLQAGSSWAHAQAAILETRSPTSMKVALRELRGGRERLSFADEMALEFRLACRMIAAHDFQEGVRAVVIDKDNAPRWRPARLEDVSEQSLDALFAPFTDQAEWTPID
ncbi:MAG: enoyl-CoA hydratase [Caulobacteraceae bacterium]|nr:enoyl-CoA hydratase [Caulobacteraceae bacterium]